MRVLDQVAAAPDVDVTLARSAGVAICCPESKQDYDNDPDGDGYALGNTHYPVEFVGRQRWAGLLHAYFDQVTR